MESARMQPKELSYEFAKAEALRQVQGERSNVLI